MSDSHGPVVGNTLVLGGARSGKSRHAQALAEASGGRLVFVATAQAFDDEMSARIARHRADRDARWLTVEESIDLAAAIRRMDAPGTIMVVDCLTLWASNLLLSDKALDPQLAMLLAAIRSARGRLIIVSNEVGLGIVPDNALARKFRDMAGTINQRVAAVVDHVHFIAAGLALTMK